MSIHNVGFDGRVPSDSASKPKRSENALESKSSGGSEAKPTEAAQMLARLSDQALELPPRNIHVLAASVQKFLLTNLEPAMRIAQEIREQASHGSAPSVDDFVIAGRHEQALALLTSK